MSYFGFGWKQRKWSEEMEINWCIVRPEKWNVLMRNVTLFLSRAAQQVSPCNCSRALVARGTKVPLSSEKRNNLLLSEEAEASDSSKGNVKFRGCIYIKKACIHDSLLLLSRSKKKKNLMGYISAVANFCLSNPQPFFSRWHVTACHEELLQ